MTVVDVGAGRLLPNRTVVVVGNRIRAVEPPGKKPLPSGAQVVDARGKYLIPGLWDMHYHVSSDGHDRGYLLLIKNGITGIRDPSGTGSNSEAPNFKPQQWQRDVAAGTRVGPRQPQQVWAWRLQAHLKSKTPEEIARSIDAAKAAGTEFLKIVPSSYVGDAYSADTYFAVLAAARGNHLHVVGHPPPSTVTLVQGADSGQRSFEHLFWIYKNRQLQGVCAGDSASLAKCQAMARALHRQNAWITPTLTVSLGPNIPSNTAQRLSIQAYETALSAATDVAATNIRAMTELLRMMQSAGMPLLAGADDNAGAIHHELALLVAMGLTPLDALRAATLNPAKYLNATDSLGTVAGGKLADLVLLDANPLADIVNTRTIRAVVANGRYFDRAALDQLGTDAARRP